MKSLFVPLVMLMVNKNSARYFPRKISLFRNNKELIWYKQQWPATCKSAETKERKLFYPGEKEFGKGYCKEFTYALKLSWNVRAPPSGLSTWL